MSLKRLLLMGAAMLCACSSWDAEARVRTISQERLQCATVELRVVRDYVWRVNGCGRQMAVSCTSGQMEPQCAEVRLTDGTSGGEVVPPPPVVAPSIPLTGESALRALLDASKEDILACVSRDRVALRARSHADRTIEISLTGDLAGGAEEGCVRAALRDSRMPAGTGDVEVIHLLRR